MSINDLVLYEFLEHPVVSAVHPVVKHAVKQAGVWGAGGGLAYLAGKDPIKKVKDIEKQKLEKKRDFKKLKRSIVAGAIAGALGTLV